MQWEGVIRHYFKHLPVSEKTPVVTLLEGNTPLILTTNISRMFGEHVRVYLKYEGLNPTASFKDRGMTVAVSCALERGAKAIICASTGNTSASASAYAAKSNLNCIVVIPEGAIALGKLSQALVHGAKVVAIKGNFDDALALVRKITSRYPVELVNSLNPDRIEGQKTAAFEICDVLGKAPEFQVMPVGNAGNITAYWKGYKEYKEIGNVDSLPRILGFQAAGAAPLVEGYPVKNPKTVATAIKIGNPARWKEAVAAAEESKGLIDKVEDEEILHAYRLLAQKEGIFVEPASAACVAGLIKLNKIGYFNKYKKVDSKFDIVCILTGHGLKDPDVAVRESPPPEVVPPDEGAVLEAANFKG
ncbi:threonine synthase [Candidatus Aerophobetes bacterium]|nr:threonine synthase [Candidatus Aerophobetes bacterium]